MQGIRMAVAGLMLLVLAGCGGSGSSLALDRPVPASPSTTRAGARWQPGPGTGWQWQLSGTLDTSVAAPVYDIDLFTTSSATVAGLHAAGRRVICYLNAGAAEDFRPDSTAFPASVLGQDNGWPGERWLDVRRIDLLGPIMARRMDQCRQKGFDAVEPDNLDGYANGSGFPLTAADQLAYNRYVAWLAHQRGLSVGLKNDLDQVPQLLSSFDFAVNEQCFENRECDALTPFVRAGKAVFVAEYTGSTADFCPAARRLRLSTILKRQKLDAWRETC